MIKGLLVWQNPDSTRDLNSAWGLVAKGVYDGGALTLSGANLGVTVSPFIAKSRDGMTVVSDSPETLMLTAGTTQYLILFAKYETGAPVLQLQLVSSATWTTSVNKDYFITLAKFVTPALATTATSAVVRYEEGDYRDMLGTLPWRTAVANVAALPTTGNRNGDLRVTLDTYDIYSWNGTTQTWDPMGMGTDLTAISSRRTVDGQAERLALSTSGIIGSVLDETSAYTGGNTHSGIGFALYEQLTANQLGVGPLHSYVHGHYIQTQSQVLTLPTAPGVGTRYDLMFLEVWQETIPTALDVPYLSSSATLDPLATVVNFLNTCQESNTSNYRVEAIEFIDSATIIVTKSAYRFTQNVTDTTITDPSVGMTAAVNQFSNPYINITGGDRFAYKASAPAVYSQTTWAIPLLVLKRTSTEATFQVMSGGSRYAYDIAPRATVGRALTEALTWLSANTYDVEATAKPSGFLVDVDRTPLVINSTAPGYVRVPMSKLRVRGRTLQMYDVDVQVPAAPATGGRRDLVYVEFYCTSSPADLVGTYVGLSGGNHIGEQYLNGNRQFSWYAKVIAASVGTATDEADSMAALGFSQVSDDVALWTRTATADESTRDGQVYAMAVAIVHRRNTGTWDVSTNPNGALSRPDFGSNSYQIFDREWVDLRRTVVTRSDIASVVSKSFNRVVTGNLRTRLKQHPFSSDVYGTSAMITTVTSVAPVAGKHTMTPVPSGTNAHTAWSASDELECLTFVVTDLTVPQSSSDNVFVWNGGGDTGSLTINAPFGMHFHKDENYLLHGPISANVYGAGSTVYSDRTFALQVDSSNGILAAPETTAVVTVSLSASDPLGNPTQYVVSSTNWVSGAPASSKLVFCVWAIKPNKTTDADYADNGHLFGSPTAVYSVKHGGTAVHVGPITARVVKNVTGSSFTVTQAEILAVRPDIATSAASINIYGVARIRAVGAAVPVRYVKLQNSAGTGAGYALLQVDLDTPFAGSTPIEITVMCDGDIHYRWVEIVPESYQVRGLYKYAHATATFNATGSANGYFALWTDRTGTTTASQRGASFAETSLNPMYGVRCGQLVYSNATGLDASSAPDYMLGSYMNTAGNGHVFWMHAVDTGAVNQDVMLVGLKAVSTKTGYLSGYANTGIHPNNSPHVPGFTVGTINTVPMNDLTCIGIIKTPPTSTLELVYEVPAYQGSAADAELKAKLRGELAHIEKTLVTTEGANASVWHPAAGVLPPLHWKETGNGGQSVAASSYRSPEDVVIDTCETGTIVSAVRTRSRSRVSLMRQVPYPSAPTTLYYKRYASPLRLRHAAIDQRPFTRVTSRVIPGAAVLGPSLFDYAGSATTGMASNTSSVNTGNSGEILTWNFQIPPGATLLRVSLNIVNTNVGTQSGDAYLSLVESYRSYGYGADIGYAAVSVPGQSASKVAIAGVDSVHNRTGYKYQAVNAEALFTVRMQMSGTDTVDVASVEYTYIEHVDPVPGNTWRSGVSTYLTLGLERLALAERARSPKSALSVSPDNMGVSALQGRRITIPSSWAPTVDTNMTTAVFTAGAVDSTGDWPRGMTAALSNADTTQYESGLFGYVPFSGTALQTVDHHGESDSLPDVSATMPDTTPAHELVVSSAGGYKYGLISAVATVTPYGMISDSNDLTLGISTGVYDNASEHVPLDVFEYDESTALGYHSNVFTVQAGGSTIDAFYPVGRPIVETY